MLRYVYIGKVVGVVLALFSTMVLEAATAAWCDYNYTFPLEIVNASRSYHISSQHLLDVFDHVENTSDVVLSWTWSISTDEDKRLNISFSSFHMQPYYTILEFGDGPVANERDLYGVVHTRMARFTGYIKPQDVISLSSSVWIAFSVFGNTTFTFDMTVQSFASSMAEPDIPVEFGTAGMIISTGYPSANYRNNTYRLWTARAPEGAVIDIVAVDFSLSDEIDNVYIGDTKITFVNHDIVGGSWTQWRGTKPRDDYLGLFHYCSKGPSVSVLFTTNWRDTGRGFSLRLVARQSCTSGVGEGTAATKTTVSPMTEVELTDSNVQEPCVSNDGLLWKAFFLGTLCLLVLVTVSFVCAFCFQRRRIQIKIRPSTHDGDNRSSANLVWSCKRISDVHSIQEDDDNEDQPYSPVSYVTRMKTYQDQEVLYYNVFDRNDSGYYSSVDLF